MKRFIFILIPWLVIFLIASCKKASEPSHTHISETHLYNKSSHSQDTLSSLYFPNGFTPDGDGINDEFSVVGTGLDASTFSLKIFDKNGILYFETNNISESWDGSKDNKGESHVQGAYQVILQVDDTTGYSYEFEGLISKIM